MRRRASTLLESAAKPVIGRLSDAAQTSRRRDRPTNRRGVRVWLEMGAGCGGATAGCILGVLAVTWATTAHMRDQVATLSAEVATLQAQAEDWEKRAGRAKLTTCDEKKRLCVQVDTKQPFEGGYYIIKGY
ncbi:hypothetical protein F6R98_17380 [Candidatus Methylospira mobilis]|uniref:Uncharacterized protein n=1 Tax=Candidatus Methylospira mobilis TaxID=1808979 RepID=A0A5Q0BQ29_9GAMM|nr:hypothetical protein [Candidatus Methylospira mobilis]QFY44188.1 hypothetical protein F6R98_17380 [Candidatus Methylospira mobilis]WNV06388.1 hypothetical protein RP726_08275 [Candidatus Methylospira mobilis]